MGDAAFLIEKYHGKGLFLDAHLLVLWLVGQVDRKLIASFKRTQNFSLSDFTLLVRLIDYLGQPLVSTPHILSQASDLTDLPGTNRKRARKLLKAAVQSVDERFTQAKTLVRHSIFERHGLGDASIAAISEQGILIMTADLQLHIALEYLGRDSINFNHVRLLGRNF